MEFLYVFAKRCSCRQWTFEVVYQDGTEDYLHWGTLGRCTETQLAQLRAIRKEAESREGCFS